MVVKCGIVEDEPLAEKVLRKYINTVSFLEISWTCNYAEEAVELIKHKQVHLLFLDLQEIPVKKDSAFSHLIHNYKHIIILSAYPQKMLATQLEVLGFLNKPISFESFVDVIETFLHKSNE
jgi:response regulator of citrate/malate metabolism